MAELIKAVTRTVYPDGKVQVYQYGMLPKKLPSERINVWFRWLSILKHKHHWRD